MAGTSQKYRNFVAEPMGDKDVTELAGIGETLGGRLTEAGFDKVRGVARGTNFLNNKYVNVYCVNVFQAYTVLGQYLILKKDEELFKDWMKDVCNASSKQASDCYNCLNDWCEEFL
ncbi:unnamed protein product [Ceratitis capitata]|uniref:(Mediterranean fruit fly) hypothetical protein n=1 Tax=Ceratitis capitata TaxID=7213 RepID=A0A811UMC6_CERCA|nr:unnamed protein product [Ceratitis capitata]